MHLRVRQHELPRPAPALGPSKPPGTIVQDVDIQAAWSPARALPPPGTALDALDEPEQGCGSLLRLQQQHRVQVWRLPPRSQRQGLVDAGSGEDAEAGPGQLAPGSAQSVTG